MTILSRMNSQSAMVFCLLAGISLFPELCLSAEWATVTSDKAVVYADPEMSSPIGFFNKGDKLRVGEVRRNKGRMLPTLYNKRIVWVRVADLQTARDLVLIRSASERVKDREKLNKRQSRVGALFSAFLSSANGFKAVESEQEFEDSGAGVTMGGFGLYGQTRKAANKNSLKLKMEYLAGKLDETRLSMFMITGELAREFFSFKSFSLQGFAGVSAAPWAQYEAGSLFKVNGYGLGGGAGLEAIAQMGQKWAIHVEARYQYLKLFGFDLPDSSEEIEVEEGLSPSIYGPSVGAALSYAF